MYNVFAKSYIAENSLSEKAYFLFTVVFFGLCMILAFIEKEFILAVIVLIWLIFYLWYKLIRPLKREKKQTANIKTRGGFFNTYKFYNNYFDVDNPEGTAKIYYMKIYKMIEDAQYYYIYITKEHAFIISKNGFLKGNSIEFSDFMKKKLIFKYKKSKEKPSK